MQNKKTSIILFLIFNSLDGEMHRGCLTDTTDSRLLCEQPGSECVKCSENGCNNQPQHREPQLSCVYCEDSTDCAFGQVNVELKKCESNVSFTSNETCFTHADPIIGSVKRGCTLDDDSCASDRSCKECKDIGCNVQNVNFHSCLQCESKLGGECSQMDDPKKFYEQCTNSVYPLSKRGCYTRIISK